VWGSAHVYSCVATYKVDGIDPYRNLIHLLAKLPIATTADNNSSLLPWTFIGEFIELLGNGHPYPSKVSRSREANDRDTVFAPRAHDTSRH